LFTGTHDGFERLRPRLRYTRYIAFIRRDLWIVRDEVRGEGEHELTVHWQCAPSLSCHGGAGSLTLFESGSELLNLHVLESANWRFSDSWVSAAYASREVAKHVACSIRGTEIVRLTTVLSEPGQRVYIRAVTHEGAPGLRVRWRERDGVLFLPGSSAASAESKMRWVDLDASNTPQE